MRIILLTLLLDTALHFLLCFSYLQTPIYSPTPSLLFLLCLGLYNFLECPQFCQLSISVEQIRTVYSRPIIFITVNTDMRSRSRNAFKTVARPLEDLHPVSVGTIFIIPAGDIDIVKPKSQHVIYKKKCSAIAERPRCRVRYSKKSRRLELGDTIYGH